MWKNIVQLGRLRMKIWRMRIALCISKGTDTYSDYVTLIVFPLQQWLYKSVSLLGYTQFVCPFKTPLVFVVEEQILKILEPT
jgi:hypothetical protein